MCVCAIKAKHRAYSTGTSRVVPHHSTIPAARSLTSRFGWDVVHSASYGRRHNLMLVYGTYMRYILTTQQQTLLPLCLCCLGSVHNTYMHAHCNIHIHTHTFFIQFIYHQSHHSLLVYFRCDSMMYGVNYSNSPPASAPLPRGALKRSTCVYE